MRDAQRAAASARITSRKRLKALLLAPGDGGPGKLLVRALDNSGRELSRAVVDDPRLVRAEAFGSPGRRAPRREDFVRANVRLNVTLAYHATMAGLTISDFNSGEEKQIAALAAR